MAVFDCDDAGLERNLRHMHDVILDSGGTVHDKLVLRGREGSLSLHAPFATAPNQPIIAVPGDVLLPVDQFELSTHGDEIGIASVSKDLTDVRKTLLELFVELYNRTAKIASHMRTSTLLLKLDEPFLFDKIYEARLKKENHDRFFKSWNLNDRDEFVIKSFLNTRKLACRLRKNEPKVNVLVPIIDFANNHPRSPEFKGHSLDDGKFALTIQRSCPVPNSDECFVSYGVLDSHDIFLSYNYVEPETFFTRSIFTTVDVPSAGIQFEIFSDRVPPISKNKLPAALRDLQGYFPEATINENDAKVLTVRFLPIPQERAPFALRRILGSLLLTYKPELSRAEREESVFQIEKMVLQKNMDYYAEFGRFLENYQARTDQQMVVEMAKQTAKIQIDNIRRYPWGKLAA